MTLTMAVKATYEVLGQDVSDLAILTIVEELEGYPIGDVMTALTRCRKELRKLTLADILDRLPTGHPGVEEAWATVSGLLSSEDASVVWTDEMAQAFGVARHLASDKVAARMAFKEAYSKAVAQARDAKKGPAWRVSLGYDPSGRQGVIEEAVKLGRLPVEHAKKLLPNYSLPEELERSLPIMKSIA